MVKGNSMKLFKILIVPLLMSLIHLNSCSSFYNEDDKLTLERRPYDGNELRLDGYYYHIMQTGHWRVYFLYRNGIILDGGDILPSELQLHEEMYRNGQHYLGAKNYKISWGVFHIDSNEIKLEKWYPSTGGSLPVCISTGEILNDSTFHITKVQCYDDNDVRYKDWMCHFRPFSPKPDSICPFIP